MCTCAKVDGDAAWAGYYTISSHRIATGEGGSEPGSVASGWYIDRMERRAGEWRIARRTMLVDVTRTDVVAPQEAALGSSDGARDRSDRSYALRLRS